MKSLSTLLIVGLLFSVCSLMAQDQWVVYEGKEGPGKGKHIVFVSGDEEYRSEEGLPMLAKIMAIRHGFKCTVLFAVDPETGEINPNNTNNIPGLSQLQNADMMVLLTRSRTLPDEQMKYIVDYTNSGKPIMGLRTATHAFSYRRNPDSPYAKYGTWGKDVLGEGWVNHHGSHGGEATRGLIDGRMRRHPIFKGVDNIWGLSDVYGIKDITGDEQILVHGQVLNSMDPVTALPNYKKSLMPVAWIKNYTGETGNTSRIFCSTMGASVDLQSEGMRRLLINGCYWCMGMEDQIAEKSNVDYVGRFFPTFYGFDGFITGAKPADHQLKEDDD
jgi:type 1 glutamine amidotransferase